MTLHTNHFSRDVWGYFYADRHELIGHNSADVMMWLEAHPEFTPDCGSIWFDYGTDEGQVDVTEVYFPDQDDAARTAVEGPHMNEVA